MKREEQVARNVFSKLIATAQARIDKALDEYLAGDNFAIIDIANERKIIASWQEIYNGLLAEAYN